MDQAKLLGFSDRLYRSLLAAYPAEFRREYAGEMSSVFNFCCRDAVRRGGIGALAAVWVAALGDLTGSALQERLCSDYQEGEYAQMTIRADGSTFMTWRVAGGGPAFGGRLVEVIEANPDFSDSLVSGEPAQQLLDVVDSMALDADPGLPEAAMTLFEQLCQDLPADEADALLRQLRDSARRAGARDLLGSDGTLAGKLLRHIYADSALFDLVASGDSDTGVADLFDCLALDAKADDLNEALVLMRELSANPAAL